MNQNMFIHRLKTELSENYWMLALYWLCLAITFIGNLILWLKFGQPGYRSEILPTASVLATLGLVAFAIILVVRMFKRDDLKDPRDFCSTRPIRPLPFYGAKLAFTWLALVIPAGVATTLLGLFVGCGANAFIGGLWVLLCLGFLCSLIAFSCMSYAGGTKSMMMIGAFIIGVVFTSILLFSAGRRAPWHEQMNDDGTILINLLSLLVFLTIASIWLCIRQARDKHLHHRPLWLTLTGAVCMFCIIFFTLPNPLHPDRYEVPVVTHAALEPSGMSMGGRGGPIFISGQFSSQPIQQLDARGLSHTHNIIPVNFTGVDAPWFEVHCTGFRPYRGGSVEHGAQAGQAQPTKLEFKYTIHGSGNGQSIVVSTETLTKLKDAVKDLPKRKIRIKDTITLNYREYEHYHRSPLTEGFNLSSDGLGVTYIPASSDPSKNKATFITRQFTPELMHSVDLHDREVFLHHISHPSSNQAIDIYDFDALGRIMSGFFYNKTVIGIDFREEAIRSSRAWQEITMEQGYEGSPKAWKQEAVWVIEKAGEKMKAEIPLDFEIEIPEPELLRKMLIEGTI